MNEQEEKQPEKHIVFSVSGIKRKPQAIVRSLGSVDLAKHKLNDNEFNTKEMRPNIFEHMFTANIIDDFFLSTLKLPIMYINLGYSKSVISFHILTLKVYFHIPEEKKAMSEKELMEFKMEGTFSTDLTIDGETIELETFEIYPGKDEMIAKLERYLRTPETIALVDEIIERKRAERIEKYKTNVTTDIPTPSISATTIELTEEEKKNIEENVKRANEIKKNMKVSHTKTKVNIASN